LFKRDLHRTLDTFDQKGAPKREWNSFVHPASYVPEIACGVAQFCYGLNRLFDGIIVSGDLATTGRGGDLRVAKSFIAEPPNYGPFIRHNEATISRTTLPKNIHLVPGNHDRYRDDAGTPGSPHFALTFENPHMRNLQGDVGHWVKRKNGQYIGFVYADFSLRERAHATNPVSGPYGQGRAYAKTLSELSKLTKQLQGRGMPVVWVIHFAPYQTDPNLILVNFNRLSNTAASLGVLCTLCGHTHEQDHVITRGHPVFCAGSACCVDSKNNARLHVFEFRVESGKQPSILRKNYRWSWDRDAFVHVGNETHN
jgi:predicted phosphodiesterase